VIIENNHALSSALLDKASSAVLYFAFLSIYTQPGKTGNSKFEIFNFKTFYTEF